MIEVELPDGTIAEFPDGTPKAVMQTALLKQTKQAAPPSVGEDVLKSSASGLPRGIADLVGLPGTIGNALDAGGEWVMGKMGLPTRSQAMQERGLDPGSPLSGDVLRGGLSTLTGGATDYQPQTMPGEFARTVTEMLPAAIAGPGGLGRKAAMATIPAGLSESAGQVAEQTIPELEPYARAVGALGGGLATAGRVNPAKVAAKGAPTREVLKKTTDDLFTDLRSKGIKYDSNAWDQTIGSLGQSLKAAHVEPSQAPQVYRFAKDLMKGAGQSLDFDEIYGLRQSAVEAARDAAAAPNTQQLAKAWNVVVDKLDDFERMAPLSTTKPIPQQELNTLRDTARKTALKSIKQRHLDEVFKDAETKTAGLEAGIRNGIGKLLSSKAGKNLFNGEERTALLAVQHGRKGIRTLSKFGLDFTSWGGNAALIPTTAAAAAGSLAGSGGLAIPLAIGLTGAGSVAKIASPRMTKKALENVGGAVRSGNLSSATGKAATQRLKNELLSRRMLSVTNANQSSKSR